MLYNGTLYNGVVNQERAEKIFSRLQVRDEEHLIAFLGDQFPGNAVVVHLFEDVDGNTTPIFGDASKLSGDEYVGWLEGTRYLDGCERTNYQWMFVSNLALSAYRILVQYL